MYHVCRSKNKTVKRKTEVSMMSPFNSAIQKAEFNRLLNLLDLLAEDFGPSSTKVQALFWLVRAAANGHVCPLLKRDGYVIRPGQFATNVKELSQAWNWQRASIIEFLKCLQHLEIIRVDHVSRNLLITLQLRFNTEMDADSNCHNVISHGRIDHDFAACVNTKNVLSRCDHEDRNAVENTSRAIAREASVDCIGGPRPSSLGRPDRREG